MECGMSTEDAANMFSDVERKLNTDMARVMDDRRVLDTSHESKMSKVTSLFYKGTLHTRELINRWKHDMSPQKYEGRSVSELRTLIIKKMYLSPQSPQQYVHPTPQHQKKVRIKSGFHKRMFPSFRPQREAQSAPTTSRFEPLTTSRSLSKLERSSSQAKPTIHTGYTSVPCTSVEVHISTPYAQRRPYTSDSQFSALMRSNSPKPRPHFHEGYANFEGKRFKSPSNLQEWKTQVKKHVEIKRKKYSIPVEYKVAFDEGSRSQSRSSENSRKSLPKKDVENTHDFFPLPSGSPGSKSPSRAQSCRSNTSGSVVSSQPSFASHHMLEGNRSVLSARSSNYSGQLNRSHQHNNRCGSHLQNWNV